MRARWLTLVIVVLALSVTAAAQQLPGSLRGVVYDQEFDVPLGGVLVTLVESGQSATTSEQGLFNIPQVVAGRYTVTFAREGYSRVVKAEVVVTEGQLTDLDVRLPGEFTEMDEFVVQDLQVGAGTEAALLGLRFESPALLDSISSDLISRAGASDAASALRLVAGATVQNGKFAVIRGLPDRYVSSQVNGVRLPSADDDTRAVELDQFPAAVIESIQVSKTFTPDQQGDASGGAVDVRLKSIPDETILQFSTQLSYNDQVPNNDTLDFSDGDLDFWGNQKDSNRIQLHNLGDSWTGDLNADGGGNTPTDYKFSGAAGGKTELDSGVVVGGFASVFYERDSSYFDDGKDDSWWVTTPGGPLVPKTSQGTPQDGDFKTSLFDVTESVESVQWGGLGSVGLETENNSLGLTYLYTSTSEDTSTLAEDTRGKSYFFPGYDVNDPTSEGNLPQNLNAAPWIRTDTQNYTQRTTDTLQLTGQHTLPTDEFSVGDFLFLRPVLDWTLSRSTADYDQPDKTQFGAFWLPESQNPGAPPFIPPFTTPATWFPYKPGANFTLGNVQYISERIHEESEQAAFDFKLPFKQWSDEEGYVKLGLFDDSVKRDFDQDTFSNFNDAGASFVGEWDEPWVDVFPDEDHPITESLSDVDYKGKQDITATYGMIDLPLSSTVSVIGGARYESTKISIVNQPESEATWFPPDSNSPVALNPGDADVDYQQDDVLPSFGVVYEPTEVVTLRASWSQTVARQTFKELTPIIQQEFLGGPIFIGNPDLQMSSLTNYDLRADYNPYEGGLFSVSWFKKDIKDPIENVQKISTSFDYTTPVNYPKGELSGYEFEVRQQLGRHVEELDGLAVGVNATLIDSKVTLPDDEAAGFDLPNIQAPTSSRDMTNAPEYLYNLYLTYDLDASQTQFALFYTVKGKTLIAGAAQSNGNYIPDVYEKEFGTLNLSISQKLTENTTLQFQAKNLTNPDIETFYSSDYVNGDKTRTSYSAGREYSLGLSVRF